VVEPPLRRFTLCPQISIVRVFGFDAEILLTGLADPMVLAFNKRVVVDTLAVVGGAQIALHHDGILSGFTSARVFVTTR